MWNARIDHKLHITMASIPSGELSEEKKSSNDDKLSARKSLKDEDGPCKQ